MTDAAEGEVAGRRSFLVIACLSTLVLVGISFAGTLAKYRWSALSLVPLVWIVFWLRARLLLRPLHYALFVVAVLAHDMGAFGWYQRRVGPLQFDWLVHFFFGVVGGLIVARLLRLRFGARGLSLGLLTVLVVTGVGGVHEIMEAGSTAILGAEHGMLHVGPEDPYDTQQDMLNNVLGCCLALGLGSLGSKDRSAGRTDEPVARR